MHIPFKVANCRLNLKAKFPWISRDTEKIKWGEKVKHWSAHIKAQQLRVALSVWIHSEILIQMGNGYPLKPLTVINMFLIFIFFANTFPPNSCRYRETYVLFFNAPITYCHVYWLLTDILSSQKENFKQSVHFFVRFVWFRLTKDKQWTFGANRPIRKCSTIQSGMEFMPDNI